MKRFLAIIGLAALIGASVTSMQAQVPTYASQTLWSTNSAAGIPAATAVAGNAVLDCRKQNTVGLAITAQCDTGGGAINLVFAPSIDGSTFGTTTAGSAFKTIGFTPTVTATTIFTNLTANGVGYWKLLYTTNDTGAALTNLVVKYGIKISAP